MRLSLSRAQLRPVAIVLGLLALSLADPNGLRKALRHERGCAPRGALLVRHWCDF